MAAPIQQLAQRQKIYLAVKELGSYPAFTLQGIKTNRTQYTYTDKVLHKFHCYYTWQQ